MPHITALAGLVPCADCGIRQTLRLRLSARAVVGADREQAGVLALRAGVGLQAHGVVPGDLASQLLRAREHLAVALRPASAGAKGVHARRTRAR
ncbi:MAG: hypothetical protein U5L03_08925 [Burkholderiaceae bacterium]|nr:hypothetical protein [Burkholderiaceae bacterium]